MKNLYVRWATTLVAGLCFAFAGSLQAAGPGVSYPGARVIEHREQPDTWYTLALGSITRSQGQDGPAETERFRGDLEQLSYQLPDGHSSREAHEFYLERLEPMIERHLFECEGRGCGGSNFWANHVFEVKELYGADNSQRYTALKLTVAGKPVIAAIYSVERANNRSYIHIDWLSETGGEVKKVKPAELLDAGQPATLIRVDAGWDTGELDDIAAMLQDKQGIRLYVVGHAYQGANLDAMLESSADYASEVAGMLEEKGVESDRLEVHGVGPLAPGSHGVARVVLIRR